MNSKQIKISHLYIGTSFEGLASSLALEQQQPQPHQQQQQKSKDGKEAVELTPSKNERLVRGPVEIGRWSNLVKYGSYSIGVPRVRLRQTASSLMIRHH